MAVPALLLLELLEFRAPALLDELAPFEDDCGPLVSILSLWCVAAAALAAAAVAFVLELMIAFCESTVEDEEEDEEVEDVEEDVVDDG
jgi:hypothetical protein